MSFATGKLLDPVGSLPLGRCSSGVSVSNEESGDELGSGDVVVGVEAVGVRVRGLGVKGEGVRVCLLECLDFVDVQFCI